MNGARAVPRPQRFASQTNVEHSNATYRNHALRPGTGRAPMFSKIRVKAFPSVFIRVHPWLKPFPPEP
jgi:hypothetical protein